MQPAVSRVKALGHLLRTVAGTVLFFLSAGQASADYHVEAGDIIELWLETGIETPHRATVQIDGTVTFPQIGTISVAGLYPAEIRTKVQAVLLGKPIRVRGADGRVTSVMVSPDDVGASVVEYRPVYLLGDVSKPGQYPFRPALTVQQAIAISGGYSIGQENGPSSRLVAPDLQSDVENLTVQLAGLEIRTAREKSELAGQETIDKSAAGELHLPPATLSSLVDEETELFNTRRGQFQKEQQFLAQSLTKSDAAIQSLGDQLKQEIQGADVDAQELDNMLTLFKRGNTTSERVADLRRAALQSATRKLQVSVQLNQARQQRQETQRQFDQLESQRRISLLTDLQDATIKANDVRSKLQSAQDKLAIVSAGGAQHLHGKGPKPRFNVIRKGHSGTETLSVDESFELQPGDVVEVVLIAEGTGSPPPVQ